MSKRFDVVPTALEGALVLKRKPIGDSRGFLERLFCDRELAAVLAGRIIRQINRTLTRAAGSVRGMHFQRPPHAEMKIITCLKGKVFDVAVDLRADSPTFLAWHGVKLSGDGHRTFVIPEGFAHGFQTLTDNCEMVYSHTVPYEAAAEGGVCPLDPGLSISWPLPVGDISERDRNHPRLSPAFEGLRC